MPISTPMVLYEDAQEKEKTRRIRKYGGKVVVRSQGVVEKAEGDAEGVALRCVAWTGQAQPSERLTGGGGIPSG